MNLNLDKRVSDIYKSPSQKIRVLTEDWVNREIYCPNCGRPIQQYPNNRPVADFYCNNCREEYELKSKKDALGIKVVNGAYETMLERLMSSNNPSFFFLNYSMHSWRILNFLVIPKHFFTADIIEKRNPLSQNARRHDWVGCNILLQSIPEAGKIYFVRDSNVELRDRVIAQWRKTLFLREEHGLESRGWTLAIMKCIDRLAKEEFMLDDVYSFEKELGKIYPGNKHIKDKIRQQLQILRDRGYLEFLGRGKYRLEKFKHDEPVAVQPKRQDQLIEEERFIDQLEAEIDEKVKFVEYLPVYDLQAVATSFKEQTKPAVIGWKRMSEKRKLNKGMFIAKVVGKSMEPTIKDGMWCLFRPDQGGSRKGKIVLAECRDIADPENQGSYTIKRYSSEKAYLEGNVWIHKRITLSPDNKDFKDIVLENVGEDDFYIAAEFVCVI